MSISATLTNALSGLTAASRGAQVVSTNIANANTEGYARREIEQTARVVGGLGAGVQVDGINRIVDETILRERRLADASVGNANVTADFYNDLLDLVGTPEEAASLSAGIANLEASLLEASYRPDSEARLYAVLTAAQTVTSKINSISDGIQTAREDADIRIQAEVDTLNQTLQQVADLNAEILRARGSGLTYPSLLDQRQKLVDEISQIVPIRQLPRDNDTIALYTQTGGLLLDSKPAVFGFTATAPITPDMTQASGALSELTINGNPVQTSGAYSPIAGGTLAGLFEVRDNLSIEAQANIDTIAQDLITRFEDSTVDTSLLPGDPGLFTDSGNALNPLDVVGLSARLSVNTAANPSAGGEVWRIRDGLGAVAPGPVGDATLLVASLAALGRAQPPVGGSLGSAARDLSGLTSTFVSLVGRAEQSVENRVSFETARLIGLEDAELTNGVDTDQELQKLLLIEQAYAANARVIQTADELIQTLIRL